MLNHTCPNKVFSQLIQPFHGKMAVFKLGKSLKSDLGRLGKKGQINRLRIGMEDQQEITGNAQIHRKAGKKFLHQKRWEKLCAVPESGWKFMQKGPLTAIPLFPECSRLLSRIGCRCCSSIFPSKEKRVVAFLLLFQDTPPKNSKLAFFFKKKI